MANFDRSGMTQAGINLMGKAVGGATIQFTRLVLGDGTITGEILDLKGVVSPKQNVDVTRIERNDSQCTVGGELLTSSVKQGFFWRECGLYAMDPDQGEILYNYAYSTKPDYIAASDSGMMEEILVSMIATVGSNTNVNVTIDNSIVFATKRDVEDVFLKLDEKLPLESVKQNIGMKKDVGFCTFWTSDTTPITEEGVKYQVDKMLPLCNSIVSVQYCNYDASTNKIIPHGNLNVVKTGLSYAINNGMKLRCIKIHLKLSDIASKIGIVSAVTLYYNFMIDYLANFSGYDYEYIEVLNEDADAYTNPSYTNGIVTLINKLKGTGRKVSISIRTMYELYTLYPSIIEACDVLMINLYPVYSVYGKETTVEQCTTAFDSYLKYVKYLKNKYNKEVIISEVGCNNSWDALLNPSLYHRVNQSSIPPYLVLKGLFDSDLINHVKEVWLWYYVDTYQSQSASNFLKSYKISGNIRG